MAGQSRSGRRGTYHDTKTAYQVKYTTVIPPMQKRLTSKTHGVDNAVLFTDTNEIVLADKAIPANITCCTMVILIRLIIAASANKLRSTPASVTDDSTYILDAATVDTAHGHKMQLTASHRVWVQ